MAKTEKGHGNVVNESHICDNGQLREKLFLHNRIYNARRKKCEKRIR